MLHVATLQMLQRCMLCCSVRRRSTQLGPMLRQPRSASQCCAQSVSPAWLRFDRIVRTVPSRYPGSTVCRAGGRRLRSARRARLRGIKRGEIETIDRELDLLLSTCSMQHATCNMSTCQHATVQHATCNMLHATCRHATCNICSMQRATSSMQDPTEHATCSMQQYIRRRATMQHATMKHAIMQHATNAACNKCSMDCTVPSVRSREGVGVGKPSPGADVALVCVSWSNVACCPLHVACCLLHVVRCMLHVARCTCRCKLRGGCNRCAWFVV